ncbi:MAG: GTP 3',8-cyclase MoaA [Acidobacteriota bacterium]
MTEVPGRKSGGTVADQLGRGIDDLRISVIDRCNFRCTFCMPADRKYHFLPRSELLTFEEITRLAEIFVDLGVRKIRLTGGEPLLRSKIETLIEMLARIDGVEDLALTTNGLLLGQKAQALKDAGLDRVTVSVESLRQEVFGKLNGLDHPIARVLESVDRAAAVGLGPIKINTVVMQGVNDDEIVTLARYFKDRQMIVRFIEYMDVGTLNGWDLSQVLSAREILDRIGREMPLEPIDRARASDVALRYRYLDDGTTVGAIASVTEPFCGDCSRARLSSEGQLFTCLFSNRGFDLREGLRSGASDEEIRERIVSRWQARDDRYSEERLVRLEHGGASALTEPKVEMYRIGG